MGIIGAIFRTVGPALLALRGSSLLPSQRRALRDLAECRTPALGGHVYTCTSPRRSEYVDHSCRSRLCPQCQHGRGEAWVATQRDRLLPRGYDLLTFTLPEPLRPVAWQHQRTVYDALMRTAAESVQKLLADPRHLGGAPGMISVLHTWTRDLRYHPHVHLRVTAGGLSPDGTAWREPAHSRFLVPGRALSRVFRGKMRDALARKALTAVVPRRVWRSPWVVHVQHAGDGERAVEYLGRYLFRSAIAESRVESFSQGDVRFRYQDQKTRVVKRCTLSALDSVQRLLQHVLPRGFTKVRHYGCFSASSREKRERARQRIEAGSTAPRGAAGTDVVLPEPEALPPSGSLPCRQCMVGRMVVTQVLPRPSRPQGSPPRGPP
jgi:hypothetical protein